MQSSGALKLAKNGSLTRFKKFSTTSKALKEIEVFVNSKPVMIEEGSAVIQACEKVGVDIPRFCYHERLGIAGNCRMCLVETGGPKPVASCAMPVMLGMKIQTETPLVKKAREGVMEFLLANHPLDCPICDQGGECDLQDQSVRYGSDRSRFKEVVGKRATENKDFGPLVKTVMTRCIHCTRCVRFANEIAGVGDLGTSGRGNNMEIGTYVSKAIESEMSGNLIDLCPVGALTSKPYAFTARPWELKKTESIDVLDAVGSNIRIDTRGSEVMRILPRLNDEINEEWISDKTRFSYDGLKRQRLTTPLIKKGNEFVPASWPEALAKVASALDGINGADICAIAGQLSDAESMIALKDLLKSKKSENLALESVSALPAGFTTVRSNYLLNTTIEGIEEADAILMIGTNPKVEAPILNTRIRKSYLHNGLQIGVIGPKSKLNYDYSVVGTSPADLDLLISEKHEFAKVLKNAKKPAILIGQHVLSNGQGDLTLAKVTQLLQSLKNTASPQWTPVYNVLQSNASTVAGFDLGYSKSKELAKKAKFVYLLGADELLPGDISKDAFVVYQGHHGDNGAYYADVILPGAAYTEKEATYVNTEGRAQTTRAAVAPPSGAREDWTIIRALSEVTGARLPYDSLEEVRDRLAQISPVYGTYDKVYPITPEALQKGLALFSSLKPSTPSTPYQLGIKDFYLTNAISRASSTMAKCSQQFTYGKKVVSEIPELC